MIIKEGFVPRNTVFSEKMYIKKSFYSIKKISKKKNFFINKKLDIFCAIRRNKRVAKQAAVLIQFKIKNNVLVKKFTSPKKSL